MATKDRRKLTAGDWVNVGGFVREIMSNGELRLDVGGNHFVLRPDLAWIPETEGHEGRSSSPAPSKPHSWLIQKRKSAGQFVNEGEDSPRMWSEPEVLAYLRHINRHVSSRSYADKTGTYAETAPLPSSMAHHDKTDALEERQDAARQSSPHRKWKTIRSKREAERILAEVVPLPAPSLEERTKRYFEQVDPNDCTGSQDCKHVCPLPVPSPTQECESCNLPLDGPQGQNCVLDGHTFKRGGFTKLAIQPDTPKMCPFCGGQPVLDQEKRASNGPDDTAFFYRCQSCACTGGWAKYPGNALTMWNMRTIPESLEWTKRTLQDCIRMGMEKDKQIRNLEKKLKLPEPSPTENYMEILRAVGEEGLYRCPECKKLMAGPPRDYNICPHCMKEFGNDAPNYSDAKPLWAKVGDSPPLRSHLDFVGGKKVEGLNFDADKVGDSVAQGEPCDD